MKLNAKEIKEQRSTLAAKCNGIIATCKKEIREMTDDEEKEFKQCRDEIKALNAKLDELQKRLDGYKEVTEEERDEEAKEEQKEEKSEDGEPEDGEQGEPKETEPETEEQGTPEDGEQGEPEDGKQGEPEDGEQGEPEEDKEEQKETEENKEEKENRNMKTQYSLVKELRKAMETRKEVNLGEINRRAASGYTVTADGENVVQTDVFDILEPLRAKNVLAKAGAKFLTNLTNNAQIPIMAGVNVNWEDEEGDADNGSNTFSNIKLTPHRLTAYVPMSIELLLQDSVGVEAAVRNDLINAINGKLEETILGSGNTAGIDCIFSGVSSAVTISDFGDVVDLEGTVESANVDVDNCKYIVSPNAKADLRQMIKGTNGTGMVFENGEVDGTQALSTSHVESGRLVYGDFSNLYIGQWGDIILSVEPDAKKGRVEIIVNAYFDAKIARSNAFGKGKTR